MNQNRYFIFAISMLTISGCVAGGGGIPVAGLYSSAHPVTLNGSKVEQDGYVDILPNGSIVAYAYTNGGSSALNLGCYRPATYPDANSGLQGRVLSLGKAPSGEEAYLAVIGDDTFGILVKPDNAGHMRWFFHWGQNNSTVTVDGSKNVVQAAEGRSYSISGPKLTSPTIAQLQASMCTQRTFGEVLDSPKRASSR